MRITKFDYAVFDLSDLTSEVLDERLQGCGDAGWELCQIHGKLFVFKKVRTSEFKVE